MEPCEKAPELQRIYHRILRPLSLFPAKETLSTSQKRPSQDVPMLPRLPMSRLTADSLARQVALRLGSIKSDIRVSPEARLRLTNVILDEIKCGWQEPPAQPSLSHLNNLRLRKRLLAHVLFSSELLLVRCLAQLLAAMSRKALFTESATLTRLAAKLAKDCARFLTSPEVYRSLLAELRTQLALEQTQGGMHKLHIFGPTRDLRAWGGPQPHTTGVIRVPSTGLNLNYLIQLSRPTDFLSEPEEDAVTELKSIPQLKKKKPLRFLSSMQKRKPSDTGGPSPVPVPVPVPPLPTEAESPTSRPSSTSPVPGLALRSQLRRGQSLPSLRAGWQLADELGLGPRSPRPLTPVVLTTESKPSLTGDVVAEDLKQMLKDMKLDWTRYSSLELGLPPLVGVLTLRPAAADHTKELRRVMKELEREEDSEKAALEAPTPGPAHPQPVTVTLKLGNQGVVQVATVQISERKFLDTFHINGPGVLYNHLVGELDSKLIEKMDIERSMGGSIKEMYNELMSRVSTKHFSFDQGPLVEPTSNTDWSLFLFSTCLNVEHQYCAINPKFVGLTTKKKVAPQTQPFEGTTSFSSLHTVKHVEKQNNSSWLNWWKSNLSSGDYFRYLSNQPTDFLHVIFQMYEEEVPEEIVVVEKEPLKIEYPPPLQSHEDIDFVPGEWNWSTMLEYSTELKRIRAVGEPQKILNLQNRLQRLWSMLEVPNKDRLDMAIKYSSNTRLGQLPSLVNAWELALQPIQQREKLLAKLECFEWRASDPNRFYGKTELGRTHFEEESWTRHQLHKKLHLLEVSLNFLLGKIEQFFGEPVTLRGRRYLDKMQRDKVEMLFWLQQRRRVQHLTEVQKSCQQEDPARQRESASS